VAELFKDLYCPSFYQEFSSYCVECIPEFNRDKFIKLALSHEFYQMELKERMTHTAKVLRQFMPDNFSTAAGILIKLVKYMEVLGISEKSIEYMFLPEYIATYGIEEYDVAIPALEEITQFTSAEFAIRFFIIKYEKAMLDQMLTWSNHPNYMVRRLASEGARPRLPWAQDIKAFKINPTPLLPIFDKLIADPKEIVRRSVANNLNDISKDNPLVVIHFSRKYFGVNKQCDWVIKHACRTLLKQGNQQTLALFGYDPEYIEVTSLTVKTPEVKIGDSLEFDFTLNNTDKNMKKVRIEYRIYFLKKSGNLARKVFKISEKELVSKQTIKVERKQNFKLITTRKLYKGKHAVSIIINGKEFDKKYFVVT
jgi:3-methyladenine DNA glycosylase AlkC